MLCARNGSSSNHSSRRNCCRRAQQVQHHRAEQRLCASPGPLQSLPTEAAPAAAIGPLPAAALPLLLPVAAQFPQQSAAAAASGSKEAQRSVTRAAPAGAHISHQQHGLDSIAGAESQLQQFGRHRRRLPSAISEDAADVGAGLVYLHHELLRQRQQFGAAQRARVPIATTSATAAAAPFAFAFTGAFTPTSTLAFPSPSASLSCTRCGTLAAASWRGRRRTAGHTAEASSAALERHQHHALEAPTVPQPWFIQFGHQLVS